MLRKFEAKASHKVLLNQIVRLPFDVLRDTQDTPAERAHRGLPKVPRRHMRTKCEVRILVFSGEGDGETTLHPRAEPLADFDVIVLVPILQAVRADSLLSYVAPQIDLT